MKQYIAIDRKSFYASVEARERGLDPLTVNLVVADVSRTEKTICLAVSPSLKSYITLDQEMEDEIYRIPVKLIRRDAADEEQAEYGVLEALSEPDGEGNELYEDLSGLITLTEEKGRGLTIVKKPLAEIQGTDISRIQAIGKVDDIYYHSFDITDKLREADRKAEAGEYRINIGSSDVSIEVSDVTDNEEPQEPELRWLRFLASEITAACMSGVRGESRNLSL